MTDRHVDDILSDFRALPLPQRMREAAKVMREATDRLNDPDPFKGNSWHPESLELWADRLEAEDRAKAEQDAIVEELARDMVAGFGLAWIWDLLAEKDKWLRVARKLIDSGWRKGGSDE